MNLFAIHEDNMEGLRKKITRIRNKCIKYGCDFHYAEVGEEYRELEDEKGRKYTARYVVVEAEGRAVVNGWKFVASVEHTEKGNIIRKAVDEKIPEKYYTTDSVCEHCKTLRVRKDTYLVINEETGEFKQVGKTCLKDFTGGMDAAGVAQFRSLFDELIQSQTAPVSGYSGKRYFETESFLLYVAETVKHFGFVSSSGFGRSTKERASDYFLKDRGWQFGYGIDEKIEKEMEEVRFKADTHENKAIVKDAMEWLNSQPDTGNDYIHNLKVACSLEYTDFRKMGLLASLFHAYAKDMDRRELIRKKQEEQKTKGISGHAGRVGERITVNVSSVDCVTSWDTEWGVTKLYEITGDDGNIYTWKTGNCLEDNVKVIAGTVKEHKEYNGVKQTELTRCKVKEYRKKEEPPEMVKSNASDEALKAFLNFCEEPEEAQKENSAEKQKKPRFGQMEYGD